MVTSSCTASLHLALILAGVQEGDEVITTPMSWVSTANVILYMRATPVFVDVERETGLIDIDKIEEKITNRTKAIIAVHLYGQMCDMKRLSKLGKKYGIKIIEDAAHALEAERDGIKPGQLSFAACFSFHAAKNLTSGQGGAIVTKNIEKCKLLIRDGVKMIDDKRRMVDFGYKYDLTDFQVALLEGQLDRINETHVGRVKVFQDYSKRLISRHPKWVGNSIHACHLFVIWVKNRDEIRKKLLEKGIQTSIHYQPIHQEPYYRKFIDYKLPLAEKMGREVISLPTYPDLDTDYIIKTINEAIEL
jgi:dTDP-4-amino-4,6-dideoxygalactose transaminase